MKDCNFWIHKNKIGTGRVVAWSKLGITNSFTLESSAFGYSVCNDNSSTEFKISDYFEIGE